MKARGVILSICVMMVFFASYACANEPEPIQPSSAKPVMVPYLNKTINEVTEYGYAGTSDASVNADSERTRSTEEAAGEDSNEAGTGFGAVLKNTGRMETGEDESAVSELMEPDGGVQSDPVLTYLGEWTVTAYCPGPCCCGEYATWYTASGTLATEGRTVACNSLPFGTKVMIDGIIYIVEDTGWSPYGEAWIDIFFEDHQRASDFGVQIKDVYVIN